VDRRGFLASILALGMAPAVVKASSIMRVRPSPILFTGEIGVFEGLTFYEQIVTIDQMRGMVDEMRLRHIPPDASGSYWVAMHPAHEDRWLREIAGAAKRSSFIDRVTAGNKSILMRIPNG